MTSLDWLSLAHRPHYCRPRDWHAAQDSVRLLEALGVSGPTLGELRGQLDWPQEVMAWHLGMTPFRYSVLEAGWWPLSDRDRARVFEVCQSTVRDVYGPHRFGGAASADEAVSQAYMAALVLAVADGGKRGIKSYISASGEIRRQGWETRLARRARRLAM